MRHLRSIILALATGIALVASLSASAQLEAAGCGSLQNGYGPFDYTNPVHFREKLEIVERVHFDGGVENLRGHAAHPQNLAGDIDYTLRAFPNHHRALYTMARYYLTKKKFNRAALRYSPNCYFQRAMTFKPDDGVVRMVYGVYLYKAGKLDESAARFREALQLAPDDAEVHYNLGLVLTETRKYDDALHHAKKAYELGHPMPGLRNKLKRAGVWKKT